VTEGEREEGRREAQLSQAPLLWLASVRRSLSTADCGHLDEALPEQRATVIAPEGVLRRSGESHSKNSNNSWYVRVFSYITRLLERF
jgi:hypothetical protein